MNKQILLFFVLLSYFPSDSASSTEAPNYQVYGRLNLSYQFEENSVNGEVWKLENNASRLGVKGIFDSKANWSAVYQIEFGVEADDGEKNGETLSQRDTYVGIKDSWGKLIGGRITIPFKEAKGDFDYFNDLQGELGKIIDGEERMSNVLQYDTQDILGSLTATLAIIPGENSLDEEKNGPADGLSGSLSYQQENYYLSFAFNKDIKQLDQLRLVGTWKFDQWQFGGFYQRSKSVNQLLLANQENQGDAYGLSTSYFFNDKRLKFQFIQSDASKHLEDASQISVALDQNLAQNTTLYSYLTDRKCTNAQKENFYLAVGIKHNF